MIPFVVAEVSESQLWTIIGLAMMALIYVTVIRPMSRRKSDPLERSAFASLSQQRSTERHMQNLLVELSEMSRQISAQLDTRAAKLETLIRQADERIATLDHHDNGKRLPIASGDTPTTPAQSAPEQMPDPRHAEVYALADQGKDIHQIASHLSRPCGEVELILALRGKAR